MTSQVLGAASNQSSPGQPVTGRAAGFWPGLRMLVLGIVVLLAGVALAVQAGPDHGGVAKAVILLCVLIFIAGSLMLRGLTAVVPGQAARVVQLFGRYRGTIRESGLQWVNPFTERIKVSTRIRNQESAQVKLALQRLAAEGVVELDDERKATMVSNLLVVLCSEQATQRVVNTGTLYQ